MSSVVERQEPHNLEAERCVLGAILIDDSAYSAAAEIVTSHDFFRHVHGNLFSIFGELAARSEPIDLVTAKDALSRAGELDEIGAAYVSGLTDGVPRGANVQSYARLVRERSMDRRVLEQLEHAKRRVYEGQSEQALTSLRAFVDSTPISTESAAFLDDVTVMQLKPQAAIVAGAIFERTSVAIVGPPGVGKTTLMLGLGVACAAGLSRWLGFDMDSAGSVIYVTGEGRAAFGRRLAGHKTAAGLSLSDGIGFYLAPAAVNLLDANDVRRFIAQAKALHPVITFWDTWSGCTVGGDENSARDTAIAFDNLARVRETLECTNVIAHHMNRSGSGERGSGAFRGALDTMLYLAAADDLLQLTCEKQRDADTFEPVDLKFCPAADGANTMILRLAGDMLPNRELTDTQSKLLHGLTELFGSAGASASEWETAMSTVSRASFWRAKRVLIERGFVRESGKRFYPTGREVSASLTASINRSGSESQ